GKKVRVFEAATGKPVGAELELPGEMGRLAFSADGRRLAGCSVGHGVIAAVGVWGRITGIGQGGGTQVGDDGVGITRVWEVETGKPLTPLLPLADQPSSLALRPTRGGHVLVASFEGTVRAWDIEAGRPAFRDIRLPSALMHANYSPDGLWVGYTDLLGSSHLRDAETGALLVPPVTHGVLGKGFWVAFRPDG